MTLAHQRVQHEGAAPLRWVMFLHGILGRGANWQSFARKLVAARPELGAVLVDLRMHGDSVLPPPHGLSAAAQDVSELLDHCAQGGTPIDALAGHSFGGKLSLEVLRTRAVADVSEVWMLDASPSPRALRPNSDSTQRVLDALGATPARLPSRSAFIAELEERGVTRALAQWLAKNLVRAEEDATQLRFGLDLDAIRALLADHDRADLWSVLEAPSHGARIGVVLGGRSQTLSAEDRARFEALAARNALVLHNLPDAGHWLHVDDPDGLLSILQQELLISP
jgi:pimeloyl-ACP methyl ester carboxylesterase